MSPNYRTVRGHVIEMAEGYDEPGLFALFCYTRKLERLRQAGAVEDDFGAPGPDALSEYESNSTRPLTSEAAC